MHSPIRWSRRWREIATPSRETSVFSVVGPSFLDRPLYEFAAADTRTVYSLLYRSHYVVGNYDGAIVDRGVPAILHARMTSPAVLDDIHASGISVVSLATPHALDAGEFGLRQLLSALKQRGIQTVGAGDTPEAASRPFLHGGEVRSGVVSVRCWMPGETQEEDSTLRNAAVAELRIRKIRGVTPENPKYLPDAGDMQRLTASIAAARRAAFAVTVILNFSGPGAFADAPAVSAWRSELGRQLAAAGADLVFIHGAGQILPVERAGKSLIFHGIGDFQNGGDRGGQGLIVRPGVTRAGVSSVELVPFERGPSGEPGVMSDSDSNALLRRLDSISGAHDVNIAVEGWFGRILS